MTMRSVPATALVIFGITGDLARRKLIPALYHLAEGNLLPDDFHIVGVTRQQITAEELFGSLEKFVPNPSPQTVGWLITHTSVFTMDLLNQEDYIRLKTTLDELETTIGIPMQRVIYLSIPAQSYAPIVKLLGSSGTHNKSAMGAPCRLLVEKPFGFDLTSATELIKTLSEHFTEDQLYRIDHYLAKETAQNILAFRFDNPLFKPLWDSKHIRQVTITAHEKIGIEGRIAFYEQTGALRDLIQSHLLQLLALVLMDEPHSRTPAELHEKKLKLLESIEPIAPNKVATEAIRGQYIGYKQEVQNELSLTETFAAIRLHIPTPKWKNTTILLTTGKALNEKTIEVQVIFSGEANETNELTFRLQPNEGVTLQLLAKRPGYERALQTVTMDFTYKHAFEGTVQPDAYERVLLDALLGDQTLFTTSKEVLASWRIITAVLEEWAKNNNGLKEYTAGSLGPDIQSLLN